MKNIESELIYATRKFLLEYILDREKEREEKHGIRRQRGILKVSKTPYNARGSRDYIRSSLLANETRQ